jgi:hypothetical protein
MENLPSSVAEDDAYVQQTKTGRDDHKHIDGSDAVDLIAQEIRQVGEGGPCRRTICLPTVAWLTSMPSLSISPWIRGAPHNGLATPGFLVGADESDSECRQAQMPTAILIDSAPRRIALTRDDRDLREIE